MKISNAVIEVSIMLFLFCAMFGTMYLAGVSEKGTVVRIDCSIAEISPDFTVEMREACRQAMSKEFQKNLQKPK